MKFVEDMNASELEIATFGVGFKRDANGNPIEQGRGAPGNPHKDSHAQSEQHKAKEAWRTAVANRMMGLPASGIPDDTVIR